MLSRRLGQAFIALVTFATAALWIAPTAALAAGGPYEFRPYLNTLKCIDDPHGSTDNNVQIVIYTCNSGLNQDWYWALANGTGDLWEMTNAMSGNCLTVAGARTVNNTAVIQYDCTGGGNEVWHPTLKKQGTSDFYTLSPGNASDQCLTLQNSSTNDNTKLIIYQCNNGANQLWTW